MKKFKHKIFQTDGHNGEQLQKIVTDYGNNGWEMCGADDGYWFFKRPIEEEINIEE